MTPDISREKEYSGIRVALILLAVFTCVVITGFGSFKFVPMQAAIMEHFQIKEGAYGFLNTASSWLTVVCTIPMGFLVRKRSCNFSVFIGFIVALGGIFIQTVTPNFVLFVIGRMIEGLGSGMVTLVTSSLLLNLVPRKRVAIWSSALIFASIAPQVVMAKGGTALMLGSGLSFQQIFRIIGVVYAIELVLWLVLVPFSLKISGATTSIKPTREQTIRVIKNKSGILIAVANIFFGLTSITWSSYVIRYLMLKGLDQTAAANIHSYATILGLISMIVFGFLSDKLGTKRKIAIMSFLAGTVAFALLAILPGNLIFVYVLVWGTLPRSIAGMTSASAADIAESPSDIPIVNSVKSTIVQVGSIVGGILMGYLIQYCGYQFTVFCLAGGMAIGAVLWILAKRIP